jgi:hypothetical protein
MQTLEKKANALLAQANAYRELSWQERVSGGTSLMV